MPSNCPDPACREDLIKKMNAKVSNKALISVFAIVLSAIVIVSGISYTAYSRGQDEKREQIEACGKTTQKLTTGMAVMQRDLEVIKVQLEKQGMSQEKILDILMDMKRTGVVHTHDSNQ